MDDLEDIGGPPAKKIKTEVDENSDSDDNNGTVGTDFGDPDFDALNSEIKLECDDVPDYVDNTSDLKEEGLSDSENESENQFSEEENDDDNVQDNSGSDASSSLSSSSSSSSSENSGESENEGSCSESDEFGESDTDTLKTLQTFFLANTCLEIIDDNTSDALESFLIWRLIRTERKKFRRKRLRRKH